MPGGGRPPQQKPKPDDINRPLPVSLEDLFNGATKKLKVTRRLLSGEEQEKIVTVSIKPGWKAGTKVRYDGLGTEIRGGPSADIVCELFFLLLVNPRIEADHFPSLLPLLRQSSLRRSLIPSTSAPTRTSSPRSTCRSSRRSRARNRARSSCWTGRRSTCPCRPRLFSLARRRACPTRGCQSARLDRESAGATSSSSGTSFSPPA